MAENEEESPRFTLDEIEDDVRAVKLVNTFATVINALGLAAGLLLYERHPWPATLVIVGTIAIYGLLRLWAGMREQRIPHILPYGSNYVAGTGQGSPALPPSDVTYDANIKAELRLRPRP